MIKVLPRLEAREPRGHRRFTAPLRRGVVGILLLTVIGGCSSSGANTSRDAARLSASAGQSPNGYHAAPRQDAATTLSHLTGCTGVVAGSTGHAGKSLLSTAACQLRGHAVILDSWATGHDASLSNELVTRRTYYVTGGEAWTAFLADPGVQPAKSLLQMQLTNNASGIYDYAIHHNTPKPATLDAQRTLMVIVASGLSGVVRTAH